MRRLFQFLFGLTRPVDRLTYAFAGLLLMALKLGVDLLVLYLATGRTWTPWQYISLAHLVGDVPMWAIRVLTLWALPFAWIGLAMSVRRAVDAGLSPWVGLLFCLPVVNLLVMIGLCLPPTERYPDYVHPPERARRMSGLRSLGAALVLMLVMVAVGIFGVGDLGIVLFAGTPFAMGVVTGIRLQRERHADRRFDPGLRRGVGGRRAGDAPALRGRRGRLPGDGPAAGAAAGHPRRPDRPLRRRGPGRRALAHRAAADRAAARRLGRAPFPRRTGAQRHHPDRDRGATRGRVDAAGGLRVAGAGAGALVPPRHRPPDPGPDGGTVLEGTTWYDLSLFPESYWTLWSDAMIHAIHLRVLRHIRSEVEERTAER